MDEIASNATPERTRPTLPPWHWGLVTGTFFALFLFTGIGGLLVAVFGKGFVHPTIPFYFQAVTALVVVVLSFAETGLLVSAIRWVEKTKQQQVTLIRSHVFSASGTQLSSIHHHDSASQKEMKDFHVCHILLIFISILGLNTGLLLGYCCLTLVFSYETQPFLKGYLWPFFVVDVVMGTTIPLIISICLVPIAKLIRYVTNSQIETRKVYRWCLPCLSYEQGNKDGYWVIDDCFYLKIGESLCGGLNTVLIYVMSIMVFLNSWLYFINASITTQYGAEGCHVLNGREKLHSYCFNLYSEFGNPFRINCSLNSSYDDQIFCLEFKSSNLIHALVVAIVLYYIMATCISVIFQIVRGLLFYSQTGMWSNIVILFGFLLFFLGGAGFVSMFYLHSNFDVLSLLQLCTVCTCIITVGFLLKRGYPTFGRIASRTGGNNSMALTPANPSIYSVPVSNFNNTITQQVLVEVQPSPSITTEDIHQDAGSSGGRSALQTSLPVPCNHIDDTSHHVRQNSQIQPVLENTEMVFNSGSQTQSPSAISNSQVQPISSPHNETYSQTLPRPQMINRHSTNMGAERPLSQYSNMSISSAASRQRNITDGFATVGRQRVTIL